MKSGSCAHTLRKTHARTMMFFDLELTCQATSGFFPHRERTILFSIPTPPNTFRPSVFFFLVSVLAFHMWISDPIHKAHASACLSFLGLLQIIWTLREKNTAFRYLVLIQYICVHVYVL